MLITISGGAQKDIQVGTVIRLKPGYLPEFFDNRDLVVTKLEEYSGVWYPFVRFFREEQDPETKQMVTVLDEESAVSPEIIL